MRYHDDMYHHRSLAIRLTPAVKWLLIITSGTFMVQYIFHLLGAAHYISKPLALNPADLKRLFLWQLVTYAFLHGGFFHLLFNMLCLFFFGCDIEAKLGTRRFVFFYLTAAAFGGLVFCLWHLATGGVEGVVGASGAIMGIMAMYAVLWPRRTVLLFFMFPMPVWLLVVFLIFGDLLATLNAGQTRVANVCHLGGAAYGVMFLYFCPALERWLERQETRREHKVFRSEAEQRMELDRILDKVHSEGIQSLSRRERKFLRDVSQRLSQR